MAAKPDLTLDDIALELYALPPGEFTPARNARAKELDGDLAAQVRALRKPLLAAWVINLFAREHADELGQALELAKDLREAQADLDAKALTKLTRERRALIRGLARHAAELAGERGERITQATSEAVEQTLNAAMFDPDAAVAVASGRLIRPLEASGSYPDDLADAVAGRADATAKEPRAPVDEVQERRARKAAERVRAAEKALEQAERENRDLEERWKTADARAQELDEHAAELEEELTAVRKKAERARKELDRLDAQRSEGSTRLDAARQAVEDARADARP